MISGIETPKKMNCSLIIINSFFFVGTRTKATKQPKHVTVFVRIFRFFSTLSRMRKELFILNGSNDVFLHKMFMRSNEKREIFCVNENMWIIWEN